MQHFSNVFVNDCAHRVNQGMIHASQVSQIDSITVSFLFLVFRKEKINKIPRAIAVAQRRHHSV